jgi:putrescine importer
MACDSNGTRKVPISPQAPADETAAPHLIRVLTLWDLVFYGIVLTQPIASVPLFGVAQKLSDGHYVTTILLAMLPMLITAFSYGRMAAIYPTAGSAYTYVGKGLNAYLGFLVGWAMLLDYGLTPLVNGIWVAIVIHARYLPQIPFEVGMFLVVFVMAAPNLRGIKASALSDKILLLAMSAVTVVFIFLAIRFLFHGQGWSGLFSTKPFYNPKTFAAHTVWTATSYSVLTYFGFEGVTTLAEDTKNPKRNVLWAILLVCLFTGVFGGFLAYLGQRVWPDWQTLPNLETAFMDVCARVGGPSLFHAMGFTILLADIGGGLAGMLGAARLLFGMGRDNVLPGRIFGRLSPGTSTPTYNILIVAAVVFVGAVALQHVGNAFEHAGELQNYGAFFAFTFVNLAAFWQFAFVQPHKSKVRTVTDSALSLFGAIFCGIMWWNLDNIAKGLGGVWFLVGLIYLATATRGFTKAPRMAGAVDAQ